MNDLFDELLQNLYSAYILQQKKMCEYITDAYLVERLYQIHDNSPKAHLAIYYNEKLQYKNQKIFCIGNYEAVEHGDFGVNLLHIALEKIKNLGGKYVLGQMQGSTWDNYRLNTHNNYPNFFLEPYQHAYYVTHFEQVGFEIVEKYFSSIDNDIVFDKLEVLAQAKTFENVGVTIREIDLMNFEQELRNIFAFNSIAFAQNTFYTPISIDFFLEKYLKILPIIKKEFVLIAEDSQKNIIGVFFAIPDVWNLTEKSLIIKSISRHPDKKWQGLGHVIGNILYKNAFQNGFTQIIHAFMRENGFSTQISKNYSGKIYKNYVLLGRNL